MSRLSGSPLELRVAGALLAAAGLVFLALGVGRWAAEGGADVVALPAVLAALGVGAGVAVLTGRRAARIVGMVVATVASVLHLLLALGGGAWWARLLSGVLAASQVYVFVLLNTRPARDGADHEEMGAR
ncbi:hypothetical protein LX15_000703 [Streptoalloteichus tenebrarius]|uniref:Integral membrane protein n=1 Tax=Streptoalloteichus tenebrarius (strain ATCC 17920 / DSM 40477 / JCM 4838 / CBS 697.72 / NBRC 16177 / NCIMB 11028 / NRRL B-12390 / A12253. 1 / ISP 5477) TaxID=1933 RepID=A0ABT1HND6_STRSD|nr:hypothetical protein [Streptoalloteichus tenebrarius]MCP2257020.1 hypothetical protein [Streptoalloteichus tenebrarius]BFF00069.1 hypothetical protein GCM10020241_17440 [Streptoalloteichus tenebrarius]